MASARRGIVCRSLSLVFSAYMFDSGGILAKGEKTKEKKKDWPPYQAVFSSCFCASLRFEQRISNLF
jgi:hypothetical protein